MSETENKRVEEIIAQAMQQGGEPWRNAIRHAFDVRVALQRSGDLGGTVADDGPEVDTEGANAAYTQLFLLRTLCRTYIRAVNDPEKTGASRALSDISRIVFDNPIADL